MRLIVFCSNPCRTECCFVSFCCRLLCLWRKTSTFSIYKASYLLLTSVFLCYMPSVNYEVNLIIINYIISSVLHAFWLVLTCDLLEDRHIDDVIIKTFFNSLLYKTNKFQVAVRLISNKSQRTSKCGKNISDTLGCTSCATLLFLPHFDTICDLLLNRRTATWNLFVNYIISSVLHIFWLVLTYDLLEDKRIDDVIIRTFYFFMI